MKTSQMNRLFLLVIAVAVWITAGTSCNTFRGVGRDVRHAGNHIERAAH